MIGKVIALSAATVGAVKVSKGIIGVGPITIGGTVTEFDTYSVGDLHTKLCNLAGAQLAHGVLAVGSRREQLAPGAWGKKTNIETSNEGFDMVYNGQRVACKRK